MISINTKNKGFTLFELLVSMGLLLLVSTVVITFISSVHVINKRNENYTNLVESQKKFREETDFWFSNFDNYDFEFSISNEQDSYLVSAISDTTMYSIILERHLNSKKEEELKANFYYPHGNYHNELVTIDLIGIKNIYFVTKQNEIYFQDILNKGWSFTISTHVNVNTYKCIITNK